MMLERPRPTPLVEIDQLKVHFPLRRGLWGGGDVVQAVDDVSLTIDRGETLGLVGESGCGKSTLGRAALRLSEPTSGQIVFDGMPLLDLNQADLRRMRRRMQIVYQDPFGSLNPRISIGAHVEEPMRVHGIAGKQQARERVRELLTAVGLPESAANRYPNEFSGGQRQRAAIARALALQPDFVVADEAVSALDVSIRAQIVNLLADLQSQFGLTYLFIAHDLAVVRHVSSRIAVMYLGRIMELAPSEDLHLRPLHPYTVALLSASPVPEPEVELTRERIILQGDVPSPLRSRAPRGCRFSTRCWLRRELGNPADCVEEEPALRPLGAASQVACHHAEELLKQHAPAPESVRTS